MADNDKRADAMAKFTEVMQFEAPDIEGDPFMESTYDHLFGEIWSRGVLSVRDRRLISLTMLIAFGNEMPLTLHLTAARKSGDLSDAELDELILHLAHYAGWPPAAAASTVLRNIRAQDE